MKPNVKKYLFPTIAVVALLVGFLIGNAVSNKVNAQRFFIQNGQIYQAPASKVDQLLQLMESAYVDELNMDSITDEVMQELVQKLDPHSAYIPKKDLEMVNSELSASFSGIGVQFNIQNDTVRIVAVIAGGPSEGVGVVAGDKLITVDDSLFVGKHINNEKVMHTLRGEKGTKVKIGVMRSGEPELLHFTITRGDIPVNSVDAKFIIEGQKKIGFVRVNKFGEKTYNEFISALATLRSQGAEAYIVDLRENSGGYMDQAIRMANEFLANGDMIVYSEGRAYPRYEARANGTGRFQDVPLAVLIDDFSASASEIFAGAIQDNDRGIIVGRRSFGKGLVQNQMEFNDGSAVRLTVARYYTPAGRCIQKPYERGKAEDYETDLLNRYLHGEFFSQDSIRQSDTIIYRTKGGREVHGGGGIMPDIFVPRDTTGVSPYFNRLVNGSHLYRFALDYSERHRTRLTKFADWQSLVAYLQQQNLYDQVADYATKKGISGSESDKQVSRTLILRHVTSYIVRNILGDDGFFPYINSYDDMVNRAVQELEKRH